MTYYSKRPVKRTDLVPTGRINLWIKMVLAAMLMALFFSAIVFSASAQPAADSPMAGAEDTAQGEETTRVLIVHDQEDDDSLAWGLAALLGHFPVESQIVEESNYQAGSIENFDEIFYIGGTHKEINPSFLDDVAATTKTVTWMGRGLDWLNNHHPLTDYGFAFSRVDTTGSFNNVSYKNVQLVKTDPVANLTYITDEEKARVMAWMEGSDESIPYVINSGNFWYFADIPMFSTSPDGPSGDSAYLSLADLLHDIMGQPHPDQHLAMVRLEDIHPKIDIGKFNEIVDYLYREGIPFGIGLIPVYINPETGEEIHMADRPEFVQALKDAEKKGGIIVLHGYSHQLYGITAVDHEFWDNRIGQYPIGETVDSVRERLNAALNEVHAEGIYPQIWETPHYNASDLAHSVFAEYFHVVWERVDAPFFPYIVRLPKTDQTALPETLGYIMGADRPANELLSEAKKQQVVRDGYAAFFFHLQINKEEMRKMVKGLQAEGYSFISPAEAASLPFITPEPPSWISRVSWRINESLGRYLPESLREPSATTLMTMLALFIIVYYWGIFLLSRKPPRIKGVYDPELQFVIVIPALNEELVLGKTLDHLLSLPKRNLTILVVNDNSDDQTPEIVRRYPSDRVQLINHPPAEARQGKGRVLNYAFRYLMSSDLVRENGAEKVIYGVLDADGRVEPNIIEAVNPYFHEPDVGAVQVGVRINNANTNVLTKWQNFEFLAFARLAQKAREHLGSVGLGGNGQFVRMSALATRGPDPWTDCLTEDLDLGINLMLTGWENHYCADTFISQQGVPQLKPLIKQRARWFQGHMTCWRHIPALLARKGSAVASIDTIYYLLAPLMVFIFLPSSLMFIFWSTFFLISGATTITYSPQEMIPVLLIWYFFSFGAVPTVVWTFWREEKDMSAAKAFFWAHIFAFFYVVWFVAGIKAIFRLARGEGSWVKTARTREVVIRPGNEQE